jgi:small subunit ribosomal protein S7
MLSNETLIIITQFARVTKLEAARTGELGVENCVLNIEPNPTITVYVDIKRPWNEARDIGEKMPRRREVPKREIQPDPRHGSTMAAKFINSMMTAGKKSTAERAFYQAMDLIEERSGQSGLTVFKQAVANVKPVLEVKSRRVGGATYQVPVEVRPERRQALAFRWILSFAKARSEKSFADKLGAELLAASKNEGAAIRKKDETHRMADANKAFSHYRW